MRQRSGKHTAVAFAAMVLAAGAAKAEGKYDLSVTRVFDATVERLWAAWTLSEEVKKWWAPAGFTIPVVDMDFRENGRSVVCMRSPDNPDLCMTWTYRKIVLNESIEFVVGWSDRQGEPVDPRTMGLPPDIPTEVPHLITFKDLSDGRAEMTVNEYGYRSEQTVEVSKAGLEQVLENLAEAVAADQGGPG